MNNSTKKFGFVSNFMVKHSRKLAILYVTLFLLIISFVFIYNRDRANANSDSSLPYLLSLPSLPYLPFISSTRPVLTIEDHANRHNFNGNIDAPGRGNTQNLFYQRLTEFSARIETNVFTMTFTNETSGYFVGATIPGNLNMFVLELSDSLDINTLRRNDIVRVRATYVGAIFERSAYSPNTVSTSGGERIPSQIIATTTLDTSYTRSRFMHMVVDTIVPIVPDIIDSNYNSYTSTCFRRYTITFFNAYMSAITTRQRTTDGVRYIKNNVLLIDYDVPSGAGGTYNNLFRTDFVVYDSFGNLLEYWEWFDFVECEDFIRVDDRQLRQIIFSHRDRYHLSRWAQFERNIIINALMVVVPINIPEYIRIVRYDLNFNMLYNHKLYVQHKH